ncbi:hypothetical protein FS842_000539 [Serendipita sp. 407]|nr:hypothetical protein FS842_000539 [Serendipita sp. 407]
MTSRSFFKISTPNDGVLLVEMNRPPVNAFNQPFWEELKAVFEAASKDGSVRVVVLSSALPKLFTAGLDLTDTSALQNHDGLDASRQALILRQHILDFQAAISAIEKCVKPVIGACHDVGLAADIGTLSRLPKIAGNMSAIREMAFTGREFNAEEALRIGFISRIVPGGREGVVATALETAKVIAAKSPIAVIGTKHLLLHAQDHSVQESLEYTATWNQVMLQSDDTVQAFKGALAKQIPKFKPLPKL